MRSVMISLPAPPMIVSSSFEPAIESAIEPVVAEEPEPDPVVAETPATTETVAAESTSADDFGRCGDISSRSERD